jgi:hypothetical protein
MIVDVVHSLLGYHSIKRMVSEKVARSNKIFFLIFNRLSFATKNSIHGRAYQSHAADFTMNST